MPIFAEIVISYPNKYPIHYKQDYFYWPAKMMMEKGFTVEFLTTEPGRNGEVHRGIVIKRFKGVLPLISYINKSKDIELVHAHLRPYPPALFSALSNKPKILTPHTYILGSNPLIAAASVYLMKRFDRIVALTSYEQEIYIKAGIPAAKIVVLPHPVDYQFYSSPAKNRAAVKKRLGISDEFVVVTVANCRKFKRIETLLRGFKLFNSSVKSKLVIVGEDLLWKEKARSISDMVRQFGVNGVIQTGLLQPDKVREVLSVSDVFVNTSDNESMCLAVYEAAAAGLPLCLSDIGSFTQVFKDLAIYHTYWDYEKLAENILYYARNRREAAEKGRKLKRFVRAWSFDAIRKRMAKLYGEVMAGK